MENASKALIMAAGILISIMIVSIGLYLYSSMSAYTSSAQEGIEEDRINQFNNKFLNYNGRNDLTIHDIITIANYARECNEDNEYYYDDGTGHDETQYYISVIYKNKHLECSTIDNKDATTYFNEWIVKDYYTTVENGKELTKLNTYTCNVYISGYTSLVYKVEFELNKVN